MRAVPFLFLLAACGGDGNAEPDAQLQRVFGGDRVVELQVPDDLVPSETYPLVLILHGHTGNGLIQQAYLFPGDLAEDRDVFVLAPDGTANSVDGHNYWNAESGCCNHGDHSVDDIAYVGGLIDDVMAVWPIDPARVVIAGHSNGGFMAYRMACARADVVTAIAPLAGASTSIDGVDDCDPAVPVSVLHIHGTADTTIPYAGGNIGDGTYPGAVASVDTWQAHNGCATARVTGETRDLASTIDGAETTVDDAEGCPSDGEVALWSIVGAGHIPALEDTYGTQVLDWMLAHPR